MEDQLIEVRRRLADAHSPRPVQQPVPLVIGAMSGAGLSVAARHADIVAFAGVKQLRSAPLGTLTLSSAAEMAQRVDYVRQVAGGRAYRTDVLLQAVEIERDPEQAAAEFAADLPGRSVAELLENPFVLFASSASAAARELRRRQQLYGLDGVTTHQPYCEPLGAVIAAYRSGFEQS